MRLVMTLVVRDEADLIREQIAYHRAQGVDHFLVLDHRSVDATPEILSELAREGDLTCLAISTPARHQGEWVTQLARLAWHKLRADWVIHNDADEFWWSDSGRLKDVLAQVPVAYRLVAARRHNFTALSEGSACFWRELIYRPAASLNFLGQPLSGKLCHRGEAEIVVHHGNHSVSPMQPADIWPGEAFEIFHFPVRNYAQFERKVRNGGASWALNSSAEPEIGVAKRALYSRYLRGELPAFYQSWCLDRAGRERALAQGELVCDLRFRDFCAAKLINT
ncbi:MAG: glycosyltransferase family 2 protein [Candidatus Sericytochromatia bacterium]